MSHLAMTEPEPDPFAFCRVPDQAGNGDRLCRWPDGNIGWAVHSAEGIGGFTEDEFIETTFSVYKTLAAACGIKPAMVAERLARVVLDVYSFDGPGGVLADSELPCGNVRQCRQRYDVGEKWLKMGARQRGIYLYLVILHETMHALGVGHAPAGVKAVIAAYYDPELIDLTPYDVQQLQTRYGPPFKPPTPTIPPVPPPITPPVSPPTGGGFDMLGKLIPLLNLLAQLGPIIKVFTDLAASGQLSKIFEVLKALGDALGGLPTSALKAKQSLVSKDDLKARIKEALGICKMLTAWTPTQADDDLVKTLESVLLTDWVLDIVLRTLAYKANEVEALAERALTQHMTSV